MTGPISAVPAVILAHDGEALQLEDAAAAATAGPVRETLKSVLGWAHAEWLHRFGKPTSRMDGPAFQDYVRELADRLALIEIGGSTSRALLDYAQRARSLGIAQGFTEAGAVLGEVAGQVDTDTHLAIARSMTTARSKLTLAASMLGSLERGSFLTVNSHLAVANQAATVIERTARTVTNDELNNGIASVAEHLHARLLWVAERDACVMCLALSGYFARNGQFNWKRTFGAKAYPPKDEDGNEVPLTGPPRHPNCRCRVTPWFGHDTQGAAAVTHDWAQARQDALDQGDLVGAAAAEKAAAAALQSAATDMPTALRREAERSILNGYALPSESEGVRARAADKLLALIGDEKNATSPSGWKVPASVKKRAKRALDKGEFTTGSVPTRR